jgi:CTP:molybdopterin cytidylyltransferase MocA
VDSAKVQSVILAAGHSTRMGFDKLAAPLDGVPLARRVVIGLAELRPLIVAAPRVAEAIGDLRAAQIVLTAPTAGPAVSLALADTVVPHDRWLAVIACDLPFLDAARVRAFIERVPEDVDLAWPVVGETPGHPVVWSPRARTRIATLRENDPPARVRRDPSLRVVALEEHDDAYVTDLDTPEGWQAAEARLRLVRERPIPSP